VINEIDPRSGRYRYSYKDYYYQKDKYGGGKESQRKEVQKAGDKTHQIQNERN